MRILCVGDVCQHGGMEYIRANLLKIKRELSIDFICVNGENSNEFGSNGISRQSADDIFHYGADVVTTGNHVFRVKGFDDYLDNHPHIVRPANMKDCAAGKGYCLFDMGRCTIAVINLSGKIFMEDWYTNPFNKADDILKKINGLAHIIIVDIHAEATAEKRAIGFYLDGRVTAVFGTHTHVQTSDACILPKGTAYITDVGMTGPTDSILGIEKNVIIDRLANGGNSRFVAASGKSTMGCLLIDIDAAYNVVNVKSYIL